jgi:hypothetical protein
MTPPGRKGRRETMRAEIMIPLCGSHRLTLKVGDILTDESWESMQGAFQGRKMPPRESIELDFRHLQHGYYS